MQPTKLFNGVEWVEVSPPVVASVAMSVTASAVPANTPIPFDTVRFDSNGAMSSGVFTAPVTSYYQYAGALQVGTSGDILVYKNGALYEFAGYLAVANETYGFGSLINLNAEDTLDIRLGNTGDVNGIVGTPVSYFTISQVK